MIGTGDGQQYESDIEHEIAQHQSTDSGKPPVQYNWLTDLFSRTTVKGETYEAPKNQPYPSKDDAYFAQKNEFAYGKSWEQYFDNNIARIISIPNPAHKTIKDYKQGTRVAANPAGLTDKEIIDNMDAISSLTQNPKDLAKTKGMFAEAALAANRHPIASLGFDPANTMLDIVSAPNQMSIAGITKSVGKTAMYANRSGGTDSSAIVHESIHNGLRKIEDSNPELLKQLTGDKPYLSFRTNEMIVRHIMDKVMGNPEEGGGRDLGDEQIKQSRWMFDNDIGENPRVPPSKLLKALEEEAQKLIAQKHPMGPN